MASKRNVRRKSCSGKIKYITSDLAFCAARAISMKRQQLYHSYRCSFGLHWHIGHPRGESSLFTSFNKRLA